ILCDQNPRRFKPDTKNQSLRELLLPCLVGSGSGIVHFESLKQLLQTCVANSCQIVREKGQKKRNTPTNGKQLIAYGYPSIVLTVTCQIIDDEELPA
ncbi:unnamed protein product, partial [Heterotrigona itama]